MLPAIVPDTVRADKVPTDVMLGCAAVVTVPAVVAVDAVPIRFAVIVPAANDPVPSLATTVLEAAALPAD